jgi:hypothetical protein
MSDELDAALQRRGTLGLLLLVVPVVSITVVAIAYIVMYSYGLSGRGADGATVRVGFRGCAEAAPLVDRRLAAMGLERLGGGATADGFEVLTRLPVDEHAATFVPDVLARTGRFEIRAQPEGEVLATEADVAEATPEMRFLDAPHARVRLALDAAKRLDAWQKAHPQGHVEIRVDGTKVADWKNLPAVEDDELEIDQVEATIRERIDLAAAVPIVLSDGPLPCDVAVVGVTPAAVP